MSLEDSYSDLPQENSLALRSLAGAKPRERSWVWQNWIARGVLSLVLGELVTGKSLLALELAAMVTRGWKMLPSAAMRERKEKRESAKENAVVTEANKDGENGASAGGTVVLFGSGQDESLLIERLEAAGADLQNVSVFDRPRGDFDDLPDLDGKNPLVEKKRKTRVRASNDLILRQDLRSLEQHVLQLQSEGRDVQLVVIYPIESLLRDAIDKGRFAERLGQIAFKTGVAIVAVGLTMSTPHGRCGMKVQAKGLEPLVQMAKSVLTIVHDLEVENRRLVLPEKLNLSEPRPGPKFDIREPGCIEWTTEEVRLTPQQYLVQAKEMLRAPYARETRNEIERTTVWLKERLKGGEVLKVTIEYEASEQEIATPLLRRAFHNLGCASFKFPHNGKWRLFWRMPPPVVYPHRELAD